MQDKRNLLKTKDVSVDIVGDMVEIVSNGAGVVISKAELHQLCKNYINTELYTVRGRKPPQSMN